MSKTRILHLRTCKEGHTLPRSWIKTASLLSNKILKQFKGYVAFHIIQTRFVMHFLPIIICLVIVLNSHYVLFRVLNQTWNSICRKMTAYTMKKKEMMIKIKMTMTVMKMDVAKHQRRRRWPPKNQEVIRRHHHNVKIHRKTTIWWLATMGYQKGHRSLQPEWMVNILPLTSETVSNLVCHFS